METILSHITAVLVGIAVGLSLYRWSIDHVTDSLSEGTYFVIGRVGKRGNNEPHTMVESLSSGVLYRTTDPDLQQKPPGYKFEVKMTSSRKVILSL